MHHGATLFLKIILQRNAFFGWQKQPKKISVQGLIETAVSKMNGGKPVKVTGCGRTDTGVHASQFYAHFEMNLPYSEEEFCYKLNCMLPPSIAIVSVFKVPEDLHSRFSATSRTYHYFISKIKDPFTSEIAWHVQKQLNMVEINAASEKLVGHKNFKSFSKTIQGESTFECTVSQAKWIETETGYQFEITANRFLRNMVRAIVGTLVEVGLEKRTVSDFEHIITSQNRDLAGKSAPAHGLFLVKIDYANNKEDIF